MMSVRFTENRNDTGWLTTIVVVGVMLTEIVFAMRPLTVTEQVSTA